MRHWTFLLLLLVAGCPVQRSATWATDSASTEARLRADVAALCEERMAGRGLGTQGIDLAADYIEKGFEALGYVMAAQEFKVDVSGKEVSAKNLFAFRDKAKNGLLLFTAHYDHLGHGEEKSLEIKNKGIHPGADDNASGVAVMLELARRLSGVDTLPFNVGFLALSGHEAGLYGSRKFVHEMEGVGNRSGLRLVINMDMVGRLDPVAPTLRVSECLIRENSGLDRERAGIKVRLDTEGETVNDYSVFCKAGLPTISITTGIHANYHRMGDTPDKLNYPGMAGVVNWCEGLVADRQGVLKDFWAK